MHASPGDYIIRGVHGEFYPVKPDIFAKTYEAVEVLSTPEPEPSVDVETIIDRALRNDSMLTQMLAEELELGGDASTLLIVFCDWLRGESDPAEITAVAPVEVVPEPAPSDKVIREFHGDNVWRDSEGVIWMRLDEHTLFKAFTPVEVTRDELANFFERGFTVDTFLSQFRVSRRDGEDKK
jgi:hypothetical protein